MTQGPMINTYDCNVEAEQLIAERRQRLRNRARAHQRHACNNSTELQPYLDNAPLGKTDFCGRTSRRRNGLLTKSEVCRELAIEPLILAVCDGVGPNCVNYRLHVTMLVELMPGGAQDPPRWRDLSGASPGAPDTGSILGLYRFH